MVVLQKLVEDRKLLEEGIAYAATSLSRDTLHGQGCRLY